MTSLKSPEFPRLKRSSFGDLDGMIQNVQWVPMVGSSRSKLNKAILMFLFRSFSCLAEVESSCPEGKNRDQDFVFTNQVEHKESKSESIQLAV